MKKIYTKKVEEEILDYYKLKSKICFLENIVLCLKEKVKYLQDKNRKLSLDFNIDIKAISLNKISTSGVNTSYFENNIINQIEKNENIINEIIEDICNKNLEIERLKIKNTIMDNIINLLPEEDKKIIKLKYIEGCSEVLIADSLNISVSQYHRNKKKVFENIYNLLLINGGGRNRYITLKINKFLSGNNYIKSFGYINLGRLV